MFGWIANAVYFKANPASKTTAVMLSVIVLVLMVLLGVGYNAAMHGSGGSSGALAAAGVFTFYLTLRGRDRSDERNNAANAESNAVSNNSISKQSKPRNDEPSSDTKIDSIPDGVQSRFYEEIGNELDNFNVDKAIWTRLFATYDGEETKIKSAYIKERFAALCEDWKTKSKLLSEERENCIFEVKKAIKDQNYFKVRQLLDTGVDPKLIDGDGMSLLDLAMRSRHEQIIECIKGKGGAAGPLSKQS